MVRKATTEVAALVKPGRTSVGRVIDYDEELARYAARGAKVAEAAGGTSAWLNFQGGILKYRGVEMKNNETELIVLDAVIENKYYVDDFDPDNPAQPVCYAFGRELGELAPHESAPDKQHATCLGCPQNAWKSGKGGKGKACKNSNRLAIIPWGDGTAEQLQAAEMAFAQLPVTSVKNFAAYTTNLLQRTNRPTFAFVTKLSVARDAKTQFQVQFELVEAVEKRLLPVILERVKEAEKAIVPDNPYPPIEPRAAQPATKRSVKPAKARKY